MAGTLDDVRVLDASGPIGHYAGRLLADLGADVIKIEPPGGDPARGYAPFLPGVDAPENGLQFLLLNANKRGVTVDLDRSGGRDLFLRLAGSADVLIDSPSTEWRAAPSVTDAALAAANPTLIHASVTGWGLSGPHAEWAYADIVGCAMSGVMNLAGFPDGPPEQLPDLQGYTCASINAAAGVIAALLHRDATGEGQRVEVSMQEALSMAQETAMQTAELLGTVRQRRGNTGLLGLQIPGTGLYECEDGYVFGAAAGTAGSGFAGLVALMEQSGEAGRLLDEPYASFIAEQMTIGLQALLSEDPDRATEIEGVLAGINDEVARFMRNHTKQYVYEEGQKRHVLLGVVSTPEDISISPQLAARDWFIEIDDPGRGRTLRYPGPPWRFHGTPATLRRPAPLLGEHNAEVFGELGIQAAELERLTVKPA